ncbi:MAG TPA: serine/threonine-protein kinase [Pyrinomonadaceae bacterium]|nr:serine/threonine-protein kinase [Pyrinomonadaceae bacterium]
MSTPHPDPDVLARELFDQAVDIKDPVERHEFLKHACVNDPSLLDQVKSLLVRYDALEGEDFEAADPVAGNIGPYFIEGEIGRGGMGTVYLGRDTENPDHLVAIKLINREILSPEVKRRFVKEMQIMARLNHANLARLLTAGKTDKGLPYVVMEHIKGQRIDVYCDQRKLTIRERLELFRKVCVVVSYIHGKGVIHRDLKPSNILVTDEGEPKLIDFGIAKVLKPQFKVGASESITLTEQRAFSIDYASPEQVRGDKTIGARSDVYSLGVVLYKLLTGRRAHRFKNFDDQEIRRVVCNTEVTRPSLVIDEQEFVVTGRSEVTAELIGDTRKCQPEELSQLLRGDLDGILLKALSKRAEHRYQSAEQFSDDINNHLQGWPVKARRGVWQRKLNKLTQGLVNNLPPTSFGFKARLITYLFILVAFLVAFKFEAIKTRLETTPTLNESSMWASLRKSKQDKLNLMIDRLSTEIGKEIRQNLDQKEPWEASQMVLSTRGLSPFDEVRMAAYFRRKLKENSYYEFLDTGHFATSGWTLLATNGLGIERSVEQINFLVKHEKKGWWPLYLSSSYSEDKASTYATAYAVLSLHENTENPLIGHDEKKQLRSVIERGQKWLIDSHPGHAHWWDDPYNRDSRKQSKGLSGLVMHVLHRTGAARKYKTEMEELDQLWRQTALPYQKGERDYEESKAYVESGVEKSNVKNIIIPWAIIATADTYPGGSVAEKERALHWLNNVIDNLDSNLEVSGFFIKAEWLIALRYLREDKII